MTKKKTRQLKSEPSSAGQSGGDQGLSRDAAADSESVEELVEEGNAFEAGVVFGVENSDDPSVSEVTTRQVPEDDVPREYLNQDNEPVDQGKRLETAWEVETRVLKRSATTVETGGDRSLPAQARELLVNKLGNDLVLCCLTNM